MTMELTASRRKNSYNDARNKTLIHGFLQTTPELENYAFAAEPGVNNRTAERRTLPFESATTSDR